MRKSFLLLSAVLILGAAIFIFASSSNSKIKNPFATPTPYPTTSITPTSGEELITTTPAASNNIEVISPRAVDTLTSGFVVKGNARVFENVVSIRLSDNKGGVLTETTTMANAPDTGQFGPFEKMINFKTDAVNGVLEVYQVSPKDGSEIDKVTVPLVFK